MASWQDAVEEAPGGARLLLDVTPAAKEARFFRHPTARVHLEAGATDRRKAVRLMGLGRAAVLAALAPHVESPA